MFNTQVIIPYVGFGLLAIFVLIGGGIVFAIYRDRKKNAPDPEQVASQTSKNKSKKDKTKKDLKSSDSNRMFAKKSKSNETTVAFSVGNGAVDATTISDQLAEGRLARHLPTRNRMSSPDDLLIEPAPTRETGSVTQPARKPFVPLASQETEPEIVPPFSPEPKPEPTLPPAPARFSPSFSTDKDKDTSVQPKVSVPKTVGGGKGLPNLPPPPVVKSPPVDRDRDILVNKPDYMKFPKKP